jgi:hypothetical protein
MATRTLLARTSVSIFLAIGILAAAQDSGEAQEAGKVGPPLETVKAFGDDFRNQNCRRGRAKVASSFSPAPASASPAATDSLEPSGTEAKRLHHVVSRFGQWYSIVDGQRAERRSPGQACSYRRAHDVGVSDL